MNKIILLLSMGFIIKAYAGEGSSAGGFMLARLGITPDTSWDTINQTSDVIASFPSLQIDGIFYSYADLCSDNNVIKTRDFKKICVKKEENDQCLNYEYVQPTIPATMRTTECASYRWDWKKLNNECIKFEEKIESIPTRTRVLLSVYDDRKGDVIEGFSKEYEMPVCE